MTSHPARSPRPSFIARLLGLTGRDASSLDFLESRQLLSGGPLPALTDLESPNNTVVRLETNFGDIDFELFDSAAPVTVANFLNYVTSGRLDGTFFHRSAFNSSTPFVLQGGGFTMDDVTGVTQISTDAPIVKETTGRSNLERTVAMARTSDLNSATSQFFINYRDNTFLDSSGGGYAVFARVVQGWNVVLTIQGLRSLDLNGPNGSGDTTTPPAVFPFNGTPNASIGGEVPVGANYTTGQRFTEADAVTLINAEIIKPGNVSGFFNQRLVMPEGFRSGTSVETLQLSNPNAAAAGYQVIARYETGIRDTVIARGTISANTSLEVKLSDFADTALTTIRSGVPYSIVVETALPTTATNPQPIAASINRIDYGADEGEGLFNSAGYSDSALRDWLFPRIERNDQSREYLSYTNLSDQTATITVDFLTTSGTVTVTRTLEAYRRGGLEVFNLGLANGNMSARVRSTQNIVAFLSDWDLPSAGQPLTSYTPGFGVMGQPGGGSTSGALADAVIQNGFTNTLSIYNPGSTVATVSLRFWRTGRLPSENPIVSTRIVFAGGREDFAMVAADLGIPVGEQFAISYTSGSAAIGVQWTSVDNTGRGQAQTSGRKDGISTLLTTNIAPVVHFTDGNFDVARTDGSMIERISIFNPFADSGTTFSYTVRYAFSDGSTIDAFTGSLTTNGRVDLNTSASNSVRAKIAASTAFRHYTISVTGTGTRGSSTFTTAGVVQFTRLDATLGRSITSTGSASGFGLPWNDATFQPGG